MALSRAVNPYSPVPCLRGVRGSRRDRRQSVEGAALFLGELAALRGPEDGGHFNERMRGLDSIDKSLIRAAEASGQWLDTGHPDHGSIAFFRSYGQGVAPGDTVTPAQTALWVSVYSQELPPTKRRTIAIGLSWWEYWLTWSQTNRAVPPPRPGSGPGIPQKPLPTTASEMSLTIHID